MPASVTPIREPCPMLDFKVALIAKVHELWNRENPPTALDVADLILEERALQCEEDHQRVFGFAPCTFKRCGMETRAAELRGWKGRK